MKFATIDTQKVKDKKSLHQEFKNVLGFPDFYGMNWDAWIDCMGDIGGGMLSPEFNTNEPLCVELLQTEDFNKRLPDLMKHLIECTSLVNKHFIQAKVGKYFVLKFL